MKEFKTVHPIDFDLYDKDSQNVIYIEDNSDQLLTLDIKNVSETAIALDDLTTQSVSSTNFHYALRFRPETLSSTSLLGVNKMILSPASTNAWEMFGPSKDASGMDVIYLKSKLSNVILESSTIETLVFMNVGAEASQGARGTRVELKTEHQYFIDTPETKLKINKEIHLGIINHRGKKEIPLHIGFVGDDTILNNGNISNRLKIRVLNTLKKDTINPDRSSIRFIHSSDESIRSKLILSFDWSDASDEWALGTIQNLKDITIAPISGWKIEETQQGEAPEWVLYPKTANIILEGEEHLDLDLSNIRTAFPSGHTHCYIQYENIPGYWDGQIELTLMKQQMVEHNKNIGIGTATPTSKLHVKGTVHPNNIYFSTSTKDIMWQNGDHLQFGTATNSSGSNFSEKMRIKSDGNVGIGTTSPSSKLEINGDVKTKGKFIGNGIVPVGTIIDWYRSSLSISIPEGWMIAKGQTISSNDTTVDVSLRGKTLPNLTDRFVRGQTQDNFYGYRYGGNDTVKGSVNITTSLDGEHNHNWLWYIGGTKTQQTYNSAGNRFTLVEWGNGIGSEGSGMYGPLKDDSVYDGYTDKKGNHTHSVTGNTSTIDNRPRYIGLLKLIRVI